MRRGIDVSRHQKDIRWEFVDVDFAIVRLGYGDDMPSQDDQYFLKNIQGCIKAGIPFGVYIYSYAKSKNQVLSEVEHAKRLLGKIKEKPFCVYLDMEEEKIALELNKETLTDFALTFCGKIEKLGYKAGIYANQNWFRTYLDVAAIREQGYSIWCARYNVERPDIRVDYDIWQYSSSGTVTGIEGNVDVNFLFNEKLVPERIFGEHSIKLINENKPKPQIKYQVFCLGNGENKWTEDVVNDTSEAGVKGCEISAVYVSSNIGDVIYQVHVLSENRWLPAVYNRDDYAGKTKCAIDGFALKATGFEIQYRVRLLKEKRWLPWVDGYDVSDSENGYAGVLGKTIDAIQIRPKAQAISLSKTNEDKLRSLGA